MHLCSLRTSIKSLISWWLPSHVWYPHVCPSLWTCSILGAQLFHVLTQTPHSRKNTPCLFYFQLTHSASMMNCPLSPLTFLSTGHYHQIPTSFTHFSNHLVNLMRTGIFLCLSFQYCSNVWHIGGIPKYLLSWWHLHIVLLMTRQGQEGLLYPKFEIINFLDSQFNHVRKSEYDWKGNTCLMIYKQHGCLESNSEGLRGRLVTDSPRISPAKPVYF